MGAGLQRAVFLDRDGVINSLIYHKDAGVIDSPFTSSQFRVLPRVPQAVRRLNDLGLAVVVVSNQPGIAKGHFGVAMLRRFDEKLQAALRPTGGRIDAIYYCLHHPDSRIANLRRRCSCRKPQPGLLRQAARDLDLSLPDSYMVGDGISDIEAGSRAGCKTVFIGRWKCEICQFIQPPNLRPDFVARDLWQATKLIAADINGSSQLRGPSTCSLSASGERT